MITSTSAISICKTSAYRCAGSSVIHVIVEESSHLCTDWGRNALREIDIDTCASGSYIRMVHLVEESSGMVSSSVSMIVPVMSSVKMLPGYYFVTHGCLGILATYRLVPTASFPQGAEYIASIVAWLLQNAHHWSEDPTRIFLVGQSAGGAHLATAPFTGLLKNWNEYIGGIVLQTLEVRRYGATWSRKCEGRLCNNIT